ncbi:MAG TPA: PIN domain-containing protein [Chthonomonadaceae bacterium]|nr:PIN domain-containing protein [Chthonomonadaceae bacterium]
MLLDTSGLLAYYNADENHHADAIRLFRGSRNKLTHSYVLAEFVALAQARNLARRPVLAFLRQLIGHPKVEVVWVDEAHHEEAMRLLESRLDKTYSLCDAVSFVLMRERGIMEALTTDRHFEQEGFQRLLAMTEVLSENLQYYYLQYLEDTKERRTKEKAYITARFKSRQRHPYGRA